MEILLKVSPESITTTHQISRMLEPLLNSRMNLNCNLLSLQINVREHRRGNQEWTIQRNWQH
jgi:hypothetical protein